MERGTNGLSAPYLRDATAPWALKEFCGQGPCDTLSPDEASTPSAPSHPRNSWLGLDIKRDLSTCGSTSRDLSPRGWEASPGGRGSPALPRQQWPGWGIPSLRDWEVPPPGRRDARGAGHEEVSLRAPGWRALGLEDFDVVQPVGAGFLGHVSVVRARRALGGAPLVLKAMEKSAVLAKGQVQHVLNERRILKSVMHPFCVSLVASFQDDTRVFLLMDYVSGGELSSYVRITQGLQTYPARFFASEVALALLYLHERNIIHRDLKPENVLLDSEGHVKIADFGFAKVIKARTYTFCGTAMYMAPEIITGTGHGKAADWWAFGVFVFELLTGTTPFVGSPQEVYRQACQDKVRFPSRMADDERDLIGSLMTRDPLRRLGSGRACGEALAVKMHPWFNSLDWDLVLQKYYPPPLSPWERLLD